MQCLQESLLKFKQDLLQESMRKVSWRFFLRTLVEISSRNAWMNPQGLLVEKLWEIDEDPWWKFLQKTEKSLVSIKVIFHDKFYQKSQDIPRRKNPSKNCSRNSWWNSDKNSWRNFSKKSAANFCKNSNRNFLSEIP